MTRYVNLLITTVFVATTFVIAIILFIGCTGAEPTAPLPTPFEAYPTNTPPPTATVKDNRPEQASSPTPEPSATPHAGPTPTSPSPVVGRRTSDEEAFCYRTPVVQRVILDTLQSNRCYGITEGELFRIEFLTKGNGNTVALRSKELLEGDFDGLVNLLVTDITGGHKDAPLPPGLFRDLRSIRALTLQTVGEVQPGLLDGLQSALYLTLSLGNNVEDSRDVFHDSLIENQTELPVDLLCGTPVLEELHLQFGGRLPDGFFDCVPELRVLEIENYDRENGSRAASYYVLDLSGQHKLEELRVPQTLNRNDGRRRVILSDKSPMLIQASNNIKSDGPASCENYISGGSWIICVSVRPQE